MDICSKEKIPNKYIENVRKRTWEGYFIGFVARIYLYLKYMPPRVIARMKGASIGKSSIIPLRLARHANKNLTVGEDVIIETSHIDLRGPVVIKSHVIINKGVEIIRLSHKIDDDTVFTTRKYPALVVESYSWIATGAKLLPSCTSIEAGSVIGAYSVVVKDTKADSVYSGFPANELRTHNSRFKDLVVVSLMGGDLSYYIKARKK